MCVCGEREGEEKAAREHHCQREERKGKKKAFLCCTTPFLPTPSQLFFVSLSLSLVHKRTFNYVRTRVAKKLFMYVIVNLRRCVCLVEGLVRL